MFRLSKSGEIYDGWSPIKFTHITDLTGDNYELKFAALSSNYATIKNPMLDTHLNHVIIE